MNSCCPLCYSEDVHETEKIHVADLSTSSVNVANSRKDGSKKFEWYFNNESRQNKSI